MPSQSRRTTDNSTSSTTSGTPGTTSATTGGASNSDNLATMPKEKVVVYLTQNSTSHHKDEIPETLAALKAADQQGLGKRSLLPISDPFADGTKTYDNAFGKENAANMTWWQDDPSLAEGQLKMGEDVLTLGTEDKYGTSEEDLLKISDDWKKAMGGVGVSPEKADEVVACLLRDKDGNAKLTESGVGASNELLQLISVLNRAENGEFDIESLVLSGHHYSGTDYLFGEKEGHEYDMNDSLNMKDIEALKAAFPTAYAGVKSVQFSACNTYDLGGMPDQEGNDRSTNEWLQDTFPNVEAASYWEGIAPGADMAAFWSGEFQLDMAKKQKGNDAAFEDAKWRKTSKGENRRSDLGADGKLEEFTPKGNGSSYVYNDYKGMRNSNGEAFHKRPDLMKYVKK